MQLNNYHYLSKLTTLIGIDKSIVWIIANKILSLLKGLISIWFLLKFLTPSEQGTWYTFTNLGALTVFAELGFTSIITQFVSHEFAKLEGNGDLLGRRNNEKTNKLINLIHFSLRLYFFIIPIAIAILIIVGYFYFINTTTIFFAWILFSIVGGLTLYLGLLQSIYQGFDKVKEIQYNIFLYTLFSTTTNLVLLYFNFKIWALVLGNLLGFSISLFFLLKSHINFWKKILSYKYSKKYNFGKELFPLQWRYAISFISSYFIFSLIVPFTYKYIGQVEAGQVGITQSLVGVILGISFSWILSKVPKFNMIAARQELDILNKSFLKVSYQSFSVLIIISFSFLAILYITSIFYPSLALRFLPIKVIAFFLISQLVVAITSYMANYLRLFKKEPFVWFSMIYAIIMILLIMTILKYSGLEYFYTISAVLHIIIILPLAWYIFLKSKKKIMKELKN